MSSEKDNPYEWAYKVQNIAILETINMFYNCMNQHAGEIVEKYRRGETIEKMPIVVDMPPEVSIAIALLREVQQQTAKLIENKQ